MVRAVSIAVLGWLVLWAVACRPGPVGPAEGTGSAEPAPPTPASTGARRPPPPVRVGSTVDQSAARPEAGHDDELSPERATDLLWAAVTELAEYAPTLVVWLFDETPSAQELSSRVSARLKVQFLGGDSSSTSSTAKELNFSHVVAGYGATIRYLVKEPTKAADELAQAMDELRVDSSAEEKLFAAVKEIFATYLSRRPAGGKLVLCVITDEMGDDWEQVDDVVPVIRREAVAVYVIGPPAPLGKVQVVRQATEQPAVAASSPNYVAHRQGPESRQVELVPFQRSLEQTDVTLLDSGFGPFALEWMCRAGGGRYLAIRPRHISGYRGIIPEVWPSPYVARFPRQVMQAYSPDYVSRQEYEQFLNSNSAARKLCEAASRSFITALQAPVLAFAAESEAELNRQATAAQQVAALAIRHVDEVYNLLRDGEKDRPQLRSPRWQAAYDLAYGQASLAKARIDGYNSMLAKLKRGMAFKNPNSKVWVLEPADEFPESSLQTIAQRGRDLLNRVQTEHPQTPWAEIAKEALREPPGWRWTERE